MWQCVAVCCSVIQGRSGSVLQRGTAVCQVLGSSVVQCSAVCCKCGSAWQCLLVCGSVFQRGTAERRV